MNQKNTDTMSEEIQVVENETGIDTILEAKELKDYSVEDSEQQIKLLDVERTEEFLKGLVEEYKDVEVTRDNYKKVGAEAERRLRTSRYALQNIHKSNAKVLSDAKKAEKKVVDDLIAIIQPLESKLYDQLTAIKKIIKDEKDEKVRLEAERKSKIQKEITDLELDLEKRVNGAKTEEELQEYTQILMDLETRFEEFDELEFEAKRLHAVYSGRRSEIDARLVQIEKDAEEAKKKSENEAKAAEVAKKVLALREKQLVDKGFVKKDDNGQMNLEGVMTVELAV
jgi:uncharacterized membrane protein YccC